MVQESVLLPENPEISKLTWWILYDLLEVEEVELMFVWLQDPPHNIYTWSW